MLKPTEIKEEAMDLSISIPQKKSTFEEQDAFSNNRALLQQHHRHNPYAFPRNYDLTTQRYSPVSIPNSESSASSIEPPSPGTPEVPTFGRSRESRIRTQRPFKIFCRNQEFQKPLAEIALESNPLKSLLKLNEFRAKHNNENVGNRDAAYLEKRSKNNEAARRSRQKRKTLEYSAAIRCNDLIKENTELRAKLKLLKDYFEKTQKERQNNFEDFQNQGNLIVRYSHVPSPILFYRE